VIDVTESFTLAGPLADRDSWTARGRCSMERALELIGTRSAMTLLREAFYGGTRFDDLVRRAGVTPAVGSQRLSALVEGGLLTREPYREPGQRTRHRYAITDLGRQVFPIITALVELGDQLPGQPGRPVRLDHAGCGAPVVTEVHCTAGHRVAPGEVVVSAGAPPAT
jgi:DNA-binding HxlR family transcriptional regulator